MFPQASVCSQGESGISRVCMFRGGYPREVGIPGRVGITGGMSGTGIPDGVRMP